MKAFNDVLTAADHLSSDEKEELIDILQHRMVENRRKEIAREISHARQDYKKRAIKNYAHGELAKDLLG
jgi:16S rRNA C1402 N4-methylase RsmH